ncbi:MAG: transcriptional repressor LexA [Clostridiaceae bacterium]
MAEVKKDKQMEIYQFLKEITKDRGYPPSVREICEAVNLRSTSTVHGHLSRLEKKGLIKRDPTKPRAIELLGVDSPSNNNKELLTIPIVGKVTAGAPILAVENIEDNFMLPTQFLSSNKELFILKVVGDSMVEAGIHENDFAIIEKTNSANNGEIVVALIENEATIKRFYKESNFIRLHPENSSYEDIIVSDCQVIGKLAGLFRNY